MNGKEFCKMENGGREISEMLNDKWRGPAIIYDFDGEVYIGHY